MDYQKSIDMAIKLLSNSLSLNPLNIPAYINLGWCLGKAGRINEGIQVLLKGNEIIRDNHPEILYKLGWLFSITGDNSNSTEYYQKAIGFYEKALQSDSRHIPSMIDGGLYYGKLGNFNKALELLSQAINVVDDKINRKEYAEFKEDPEDLKHIEGELLGLKAQAFYKRGWIYQEIGDVRKSEQDYASYDKIYSFLNMVGFKDYNAL